MSCSSLTANFVQNLRGRSVFLCLFFVALPRYDSGVIIFAVPKYMVHRVGLQSDRAAVTRPGFGTGPSPGRAPRERPAPPPGLPCEGGSPWYLLRPAALSQRRFILFTAT